MYREPETAIEFLALDRMDDEQIVKSMRNGLIEEKFVYSFESRGDKVVGLSAKGIETIAYSYGGIDVEVVDKTDDSCDGVNGYYGVICKATDKLKDLALLGGAEQSKKSKGKRDTFALAKAVTKAQRNALRKILPTPLVERMVEVYLEAKTEQERLTRIESIRQRVDDFGYRWPKVREWLDDKYDVNEIAELDNTQLRQVIKFIISPKSKEILT